MLDAVASLVKLLESNDALDNLINDLFTAHLPIEFETLSQWPVITSFKASFINLLRNNELPSLTDFYYTYRFLLFYLPYYFSSNFLIFVLLRIAFLRFHTYQN